MSAIAGRLHFDTAQISSAYLIRLGAALERVGPDGAASICDLPGISMVYRPHYTTEEETLTEQPFAFKSVLITLDGRLDNREELIHTFAMRDRRVADVE